MVSQSYYCSPVGRLLLTADNDVLFFISWGEDRELSKPTLGNNWLLDLTKKELDRYFKGQLNEFKIPLAPQCTNFQSIVLNEIRKIPYGQTRSYQDVAKNIGNPKACRAVGLANNKNPIPIIIPCHRVIGKNGSLTGYAGGLEVKSFLLNLEYNNR